MVADKCRQRERAVWLFRGRFQCHRRLQIQQFRLLQVPSTEWTWLLVLKFFFVILDSCFSFEFMVTHCYAELSTLSQKSRHHTLVSILTKYRPVLIITGTLSSKKLESSDHQSVPAEKFWNQLIFGDDRQECVVCFLNFCVWYRVMIGSVALGGALDLWSRGHEFDSRPVHCQVSR